MINIVDELAVLTLKGLGKLPLSWTQRIGAGIGALFAALPSDAKRVSQINISLCFPDQTPEWREALTRKSLQETVITACEMGPAWTGKVEHLLKHILTVEGHEAVNDSLGSGKGVILLVPHLGNWEMAGYYLATHYDFGAMYQPLELPKLNELILKARSQLRSVIVPTDKSGVMTLFKRLKRNKMVGILPDQKPDHSSGVLAPFFGVPALTQTLGPRLASQANADAFGMVCLRDRKTVGYHLKFFPLDTDVYDKDMEIACSAMNRSLESWIKMCPEQYQWEYKRFGKRPAPFPDVYKKQR